MRCEVTIPTCGTAVATDSVSSTQRHVHEFAETPTERS